MENSECGTHKLDVPVLGLVDYGVVDSSNTSKKTANEEVPRVIIVSRSHAGEVRNLIEKAFNRDRYRIEAAGGAGYKVLSVLRGSAGTVCIHHIQHHLIVIGF